ncbi:hypothetical protein PV05_10083 [Exophiala xenobiotica]|uniref:Zn(2)-C6 fungal-type domain-containing protein n=1 Tax=Exophiala xenobiotica TaxID=348802 RepID=A0A0D2E9L4_9EURO|nr:uncharacterized protein PV05_10083 [Exophiala xenobiotica]KIW51350.1 hypothetical protein PV05_10083 [Exophiala xenobiotica]
MESEDSRDTEQRSTRIRAGCESCRQRHLKCDERQPSCLQCELLKVNCEREEKYRFRHLTWFGSDDECPDECEFEFPTEQRWLSVPPSVIFVDDHAHFDLTGIDVDDNGRLNVVDLDVPSRSGETEAPAQDDDYNVSDLFDASPAALYNTTLFLTTAEEASLFRHFLEKLGPWFDMNDNEKTFTRELVRKAHVSPILLKAVLALSSRHLATIANFDSSKAERYSEECVQEMIVCLANRVESMNDDLFAATIILRTKEEMDAYPHGMDLQAHLLGIKAFTHSDWLESSTSSLRECTYWSALRQEINFALVQHRPLDINLRVNFIRNTTFDLTNEHDWSNYCTLNLANIIMFCFGSPERSTSEYRALYDESVRVSDTLPSTYHPFYYAKPGATDTSTIPQIWLASEAAVFSLQYLFISKILLLCFDPTVPIVGYARRLAAEKIDRLSLKYLRSMGGIALSHHTFGPAMILASLGISLCGDRVADMAERNKLLEILTQTQVEHAIPTTSTRHGLLRAWNLIPQGDSTTNVVSPDLHSIHQHERLRLFQ